MPSQYSDLDCKKQAHVCFAAILLLFGENEGDSYAIEVSANLDSSLLEELGQKP